MKYEVLISDLDNTLYDWVGYFVPALYAMIGVAAEKLDCEESVLVSDLRKIHQFHGDAEHPFSLLETDSVRQKFSGKDRETIADALDEAFLAFNQSRKRNLKVYPGVHEALGVLLENGVRVIGHTEARPLAVKDRAKRLNLEPYFDRIYCRERAEAHIGGDFGSTEAFTLVELSHHQQKPSPSVLREICEREDIDPSRALYVGDSLFKDVSMANAAGVDVAWAQYGTVSQQDLYPKLVAISHWRDEEIIRAKEFSRNKASARPDFVLDKSFFDILSCFGLHIEEGAGKLSRALGD